MARPEVMVVSVLFGGSKEGVMVREGEVVLRGV